MSKPVPARGVLPPDVERATRTIHSVVFGAPYREGEGPMHYATGPYWGRQLRRMADMYEQRAAATRICAEFLPREEAPHE